MSTWSDIWNWLSHLPQSGATFLGTLTGSSLGLVAVLIGALFNARLNRKRDDALREADKRAVATALRAELASMHRALIENAKFLKTSPPPDSGGVLVPDLNHSVRVLAPMLPKIGLLEPETIRKVITAYGLLEEYAQSLVFAGGQLQQPVPSAQRVIGMSREKLAFVAELNEARAGVLLEAVEALDECLALRKLRLVPAWVGSSARRRSPLEKLEELRDKGILSEDEFPAQRSDTNGRSTKGRLKRFDSIDQSQHV